MPKIKLIRQVTFPDGVKAKGEVVTTDKATADWLIQRNAAKAVKNERQSKATTDNQGD